jgi:hypothetical protein
MTGMIRICWVLCLFSAFVNEGCSVSRKAHGIDSDIKSDSHLLKSLIHSSKWMRDSVVGREDQLSIQVIYTEIARRKDGHPIFTHHYFNLDMDRYFYPASTVKLPVVLLALQRLNELKAHGIDKYTTMLTGSADSSQMAVARDSSAANGQPTIAHYIKKILLVSDNDAFNRLYEFLGQEYINGELQRLGYADAQIIHRLSILLTEKQNRHTNPITFVDKKGAMLYQQPDRQSQLRYHTRNIKLGEGYMDNGEIVREPFDFSLKNYFSLSTLHRIMQSVIFPTSLPADKRFNLTNDDYAFVRNYLQLYPRESIDPIYDSLSYPDNYAKKLLFGNHVGLPSSTIRIYNKIGNAYGFLTDVAYIIDTRRQIEFLLSATIYCNRDGIFNDDHYDYDSIGHPFMGELGKIIYDYELKKRSSKTTDNF